MMVIPAIIGGVLLAGFVLFLSLFFITRKERRNTELLTSVESLAEAIASSAAKVVEPPVDESDEDVPIEDEPEIPKITEPPGNDNLLFQKMDDDMKAKLTKMIADLPPLPRASMDLLPMLSNPATNARDIARVVSADPLLAAKILRRVNSSYYGLQDKINSIQHAVMLIGFDNIRSITLRESFDSVIKFRPVDCLTANTLWAHSAAISIFAKHLSHKARGSDPELAGTAGLLHDIGLLVMMALKPQKLVDAFKLSVDELIPLCSAEEQVFGYNHQVLGEILGTRWNLSDGLISAIGWHHSPSSDENIHVEAAVIWLAHSAASKYGYSYRPVAYPPEESEQLAAKVGLRWPIFDLVTQPILRELQRATTLWGALESIPVTTNEREKLNVN